MCCVIFYFPREVKDQTTHFLLRGGVEKKNIYISIRHYLYIVQKQTLP